MYMLRTEIRKLGGLICFLFVVLAIQAQQYTVTGGSGTPYLLENPGNRIRIYLVYGMENVEISYTSSSTNHQWYRYKQKALDREPVSCEQNGAGKNDQTALLCVGSVPRGIGRAFGLEGCVFRSDALNIDSGDRAPVLRRHRPDDDLIHTFILGGPKNARTLFPLPDRFQYSRICRTVQEADCTEIALTSHPFVIQ